MGKLTFLLGGARSGKSSYGQQLAEARAHNVIYIATAEALDKEMQERIRIHRLERPSHWQTLEAPRQVVAAWKAAALSANLVFLDCITMLVSNLMLDASVEEGRFTETTATQTVNGEIERLLDLIKNSPADWILISNEVGMGVVPPTVLGRAYRDILGRVNQRIAVEADEAFLLFAGRLLPLLKIEDIK